MTTKEAVIEMIRRLPDDVSTEDIMEELYVRQRIEEGLRQAEAGEVISHEDVKKRMARWLE
jgi:predicted transcriptional regulator